MTVYQVSIRGVARTSKTSWSFQNAQEGCRIIKLERNYRSVPEVLAVANACIRGNPEQFQKKLRPTRKTRNKPQVFFLRDGDEQARTVLPWSGASSRTAMRCVTWRCSTERIFIRLKQMLLGRARLPFVITSGIGVFEQAHVKDVIAFLRVCENGSDRVAFGRLLGLLSGVGEKTIESCGKP